MDTNELPQWSTFWDQGFITTFGPSKPDNYDGVLRDFWHEKFLELPVGARVLDIATGNGAIATIAAQAGLDHNKELFVAATDLARISTDIVGSDDTVQLRESIEFHSDTPCEDQPFKDDYFDCVSSQFGFEYSNIERTLQEVRRVLKEGGQFIAISHHVRSQLIKAAYAELQVYRHALDKLNIFGTVREYFDALGELGGSREDLNEAVKLAAPHSRRVNDCMNAFRDEHPNDECAKEIVAAVGYLARGASQTPKAERLGAVDAAQVSYRMAQARLEDMVDAAMDQEDIDSLTVHARSAGFTSVNCLSLFVEDGGLAGWQIHMR